MSADLELARVTRSPQALYSPPRASQRRRRCDGHLRDRHFIEPGDLVVWSALPPDSDIGNPNWWHNALCVATCAPADTIPAPEGETR